MTLAETLLSVWQQVLVEKTDVVRLERRAFPVDRTRKKGLRTVDFSYGEHQVTGIEQNPRTQSRWAQMARQGKRVMQFSSKGRYIGVVAEGHLTRYGAWEQLELPE
ncbi:MAG TPA: hypothetical protein VNK82_04450 [Terriglobales bacterium]|nr:hypothetical protein [Terriglobales bacterium]